MAHTYDLPILSEFTDAKFADDTALFQSKKIQRSTNKLQVDTNRFLVTLNVNIKYIQLYSATHLGNVSHHNLSATDCDVPDINHIVITHNSATGQKIVFQ